MTIATSKVAVLSIFVLSYDYYVAIFKKKLSLKPYYQGYYNFSEYCSFSLIMKPQKYFFVKEDFEY